VVEVSGAPVVAVPDQFNAAVYFLDRNIEEGRGEKVAIRVGEQAYTYRQVQELTNRVGNALRGLGVEMENRVALLLLDSVEFVATFLGAMKIGAVPVPLNTLLRPSDYLYLLNDSRAKVLVAHAQLWEPLRSIAAQLKYLRWIVVVGPGQGQELPFQKWVAEASPEPEGADTSKDDVAFWLYSSGTTGFPKGAVHLQHDMVYCAELYAKGILGMSESDITLSAAKLFFAYGLGNSLYFPSFVGAASVYYPERPLPEKMFEVITRFRPTLFFAVPTLYAAMLQVPEAERRYDLSSLRLCVSAGEALPAEIYRRWQDRFGVEIIDGIGTTEVLHIFISNRPGRAKPGSSGLVVPGYKAKIVDEEGKPVKQGEIGNLMVRGDSIAAYYWNKHEATKKTMVGEWIYTGDKYYQDEEGYFWYCGRSDDMLKVGGIWVSPIEVESALIEHPAVLETAVVGHKDEDGLVKPKAFVVLKADIEGTPQLAAELQAFVKERIAPYKYPRWLEFVDELPKTATGKIQRFKLRH